MKKWTLTSAAVFATSLFLAFFLFKQGSLWWIILGAAMGGSLCLAVFSLQESGGKETEEQAFLAKIAAYEKHASDLEGKLAEAQVFLDKEKERMQKKQQEALDKCESYKRLVLAHEARIDDLMSEAKVRSEALLAKERKAAELELYLEDPTVFPKEDEFLFQQLKKQVEEKTEALQRAKEENFQLESKLLLLEQEVAAKTLEESGQVVLLSQQLKSAEEDKERIHSELVSLEQLVAEVSSQMQAASAIAEKFETQGEENRRLQEELFAVQKMVAEFSLKKKKTPASLPKKGRKKSDAKQRLPGF